jgi:hypothetical protein
MTTLHEHYTARADEARADAQTATLDNVRERCLRAAAAWDVMAARARRTDLMRARQQADKDAAHKEAAEAAAGG